MLSGQHYARKPDIGVPSDVEIGEYPLAASPVERAPISYWENGPDLHTGHRLGLAAAAPLSQDLAALS